MIRLPEMYASCWIVTFCLCLLFPCLEPRSGWPRKNLRFMINHVLSLLQFHLGFAQLGEASEHCACERELKDVTCFSSFSSCSTSEISCLRESSFIAHFATASGETCRCRTESSAVACLIAALSILRSASPTRVTDLHAVQLIRLNHVVMLQSTYRPTLPARAVRPTRCRYCANCEGMS